jgi:hypothetical protein
LEGASDLRVAFLHIEPTDETNIPIIVTFINVQVGHTFAMVIPLL